MIMSTVLPPGMGKDSA